MKKQNFRHIKNIIIAAGVIISLYLAYQYIFPEQLTESNEKIESINNKRNEKKEKATSQYIIKEYLPRNELFYTYVYIHMHFYVYTKFICIYMFFMYINIYIQIRSYVFR